MVLLRLAVGFIGVLITSAICMSAVRTVVVPRANTHRLPRWIALSYRKIFSAIAGEKRPFEARDRVLALRAPLSLLTLPIVWIAVSVAGGTLTHWALIEHTGTLRSAVGAGWKDAFLRSGSSILTLGVRFSGATPNAVWSFLQATLGLGLVALLISYLPSIYASFSKRETLVALLESRAGLPPSPFQMLVRYQRIGALAEIDDDLFIRWETWFVEVEESHTSFAALAFFRSPMSERSWITAAGCVLDTASLYLSVVDGPRQRPRAALCLRAGFLALNRLANLFGLPIDEHPSPTDPISITRAEFDQMIGELRTAGIPLREDLDLAWADFSGWRVNYDKALVGLAHLVVAPPGVWSSDRPRIM